MTRSSGWVVHWDPSEPARGDAGEAPAYSVIVPVYSNQATLAELVDRLTEVAARLQPAAMEAVFVVDGAPDDSLGVLRTLLPSAGIPTQLVVHSRNFGSFAAIRTGMNAARGDYLAVMAADLQEPPELMSDFFEALTRGGHDIAIGRRVSREDPAISSTFSKAFWGLYRKTINPDIPPGGVDVFACTRPIAEQLILLTESHSSLVGLLFWVGHNRVEVPYSRLPREHGRSGWTLRKRMRYLLDSVYSFTDIPISVLTAVGTVGSIGTLVVSLIVFLSWATGGISEVGYTPLMLVMLFSTFTILLGLGVVGSYVWRTYENSKARPWAITVSREYFDGR
jgi:glycosyltransferase involved in cell wall biosynthesis